MESLALSRRLDDTSSNDKIAEMFTLISLDCEALDHRLQDLHDLVLADAAPVELVEPLPLVPTAQIDVVVRIAFPYQANFPQPRSCASIRATSDPHHNALLPQTRFLKGVLEFRDHVRNRPLAFSHSQP